MSTNAFIGIEKISKTGGIKIPTVYNHWDGYTEHLGALLLKHYNTKQKVQKIIRLGDASSLDRSLNAGGESGSVFYHRDRGKPLRKRVFTKWEQLKEQENAYLFTDESEWLVSVNSGAWQKLSAVIANIPAEKLYF